MEPEQHVMPMFLRHYQLTSVATYSHFHQQNRKHSDAFYFLKYIYIVYIQLGLNRHG